MPFPPDNQQGVNVNKLDVDTRFGGFETFERGPVFDSRPLLPNEGFNRGGSVRPSKCLIFVGSSF